MLLTGAIANKLSARWSSSQAAKGPGLPAHVLLFSGVHRAWRLKCTYFYIPSMYPHAAAPACHHMYAACWRFTPDLGCVAEQSAVPALFCFAACSPDWRGWAKRACWHVQYSYVRDWPTVQTAQLLHTALELDNLLPAVSAYLCECCPMSFNPHQLLGQSQGLLQKAMLNTRPAICAARLRDLPHG